MREKRGRPRGGGPEENLEDKNRKKKRINERIEMNRNESIDENLYEESQLKEESKTGNRKQHIKTKVVERKQRELNEMKNP